MLIKSEGVNESECQSGIKTMNVSDSMTIIYSSNTRYHISEWRFAIVNLLAETLFIANTVHCSIPK